MKVFEKQRLRPNQLRTVADRRFGDAIALRDTGENERANGAIYLGGLVVECLLKAKMLERFPWLMNAGFAAGRTAEEQRRWLLCYRWHSLDELLGELPAIQSRIAKLEQRESNRLLAALKSICGQWTIYVRYSPQSADIGQADEFLRHIEELRPWLK